MAKHRAYGPALLTAPQALLFDWHATLVDTRDAMYLAVEEVIPRLAQAGLIEQLVRLEDCRNAEDAKLVEYVRQHQCMHPRILSQRRISRTDIFEVLFGVNEAAKRQAHALFDQQYARLFGQVDPLEPGIAEMFAEFRAAGIALGILSNRRRGFMAHELWAVDNGKWVELIDTMVCGDDVARRKPAPDLILKALDNLGIAPGEPCWYVGDSASDVIAAKRAGVTAVFYNGIGWDQAWLDSIFPATHQHPEVPDRVVANFAELRILVDQCHTR